MRKLIGFAALVLVCGVSARAQDRHPAAEIFGGYSYLSVEGEELIEVDRQGVHGAGFSFAANFSKSIGMVADFSYNSKKNIAVGPFDTDLRTVYYLFGPRFSARGGTATAFVHALAGGARNNAEVTGLANISENNFALGLGGGLDLNPGRKLSIRAFQVDYLPTRNDTDLGDKTWTHNFRVQAGIVIKLGG